jgi:UDP-N-acetylglucosamine--N-acetylmuramyl-(pentapeptide) pyrophosphoryl-undecaprenol N-acetylglucosamine transferase
VTEDTSARSLKPLRVILAGGGTGGHVYPAIAIAARLRELQPNAAILFIGTSDRMEAQKVPAAGFDFAAISVRGVAGRQSPLRRARALGRLALGLPLWQSLRLLRRFRPDVVVGTGGYVCGPVILAARLLRVPTMTVEQNEVPGLTTRLVSRLVDVAALVSEGSAARYQRSRRTRVEITGNPVRPEILAAKREAGAAALGLDAGLTTVFAFGGSIGSLPLNRAFVGALELLAAEGALRGVQVVHLTGRENAFRLGPSRVEALGLRYLPLEYLDAMHHAFAAADLVVTRAGGTTLAEIAARGLPAIIIPWSGAAANHQEQNAVSFAQSRAGSVIHDSELTPQRLAAEMKRLLADPAGRSEMARRCRELGRPAAADRVIAIIEELAAHS